MDNFKKQLDFILEDYHIRRHKDCDDSCGNKVTEQEGLEAIINLIQQEIAKARIDELEQMPSGAWRMGQSFLFDRIVELQAQLKELE